MNRLFALFASLGLTLTASPATQKKALDPVTLKGEGDAFAYSSQVYGAEESFVYTAQIDFRSGQAAALSFGGKEGERCFVFNIDRYENRTKLLYFHQVDGSRGATELRSEYYIGNDKATESELNVIRPKVRECPQYHLKVVLTVEEGHAYAECFIDNIKRFGVDEKIDLNALSSDWDYEGGALGYNVFAAEATFSELTYGKSDYAYYTEPYRNQYHYSQFAHWNNDPNGLVYYKGYYHLYYQTHPYSQYWDHMYWGHARSKDLVHWQELPYCLFPDDGTQGVGLSVGYAWSGIAMVYHPGMSAAIDEKNWFPNGGGEGLLGYYTRDGAAQDQVIITSDDGGMTWTKRQHISQYLIHPGEKCDCRDPSIFSLEKDSSGKTTRWGMALSGGTQNQFWFLTSTNLLGWSYAGGYGYTWPECVSVYSLKDNRGSTRHCLVVSSRTYAVGYVGYNGMTQQVFFTLPDGRDYSAVGESYFKKADQALDSYAGQGFYIDDEASAYYGKTVAINWNFGMPDVAESGLYPQVRHPWNGGMTMPVELGLIDEGGDFSLTQKPITLDNDAFEKTNIVSLSNQSVSSENDVLGSVNSHIIELSAQIDNPNEESVEFRIAQSDDEYTAFGWNKEDGYYLDRRHTSTAGISFQKFYSSKFVTNKGDGKNLDFYALSDNGCLELFCDDFRYAFYANTLAAPYSIGAELVNSGDITLTSLSVNEIGSIWHKDADLEEGILYLDQDDLSLDLSLCQSKDVHVYSSNHEEISYELVSGEGVIEYAPIKKGVRITAKENGEAELRAVSASQTRSIYVHVNEAEIDCDYPLVPSGVKSGTWRKSDEGLIGSMRGGDGYYVSPAMASDFSYSASFSLEATAAGLLVRAKEDLSDFVMCNLDAKEKIVKVFTPHGELARASVELSSLEDIEYSVSLLGNELDISLNGKKALHASLPFSTPTAGYLGLNVFDGQAIFDRIHLAKSDYEYDGQSDLVIENEGGQRVTALYNQSLKNARVNPQFYHVEGETLVISKAYFETLHHPEGAYHFYAMREGTAMTFTVLISGVSYSEFADMNIQEGLDAIVFVGSREIISVTVNGTALEGYVIKDSCLRIPASALTKEDNLVSINGGAAFHIHVIPLPSAD